MEKIQHKVALLHHTGGGNLGDDATMQAVICNITRRWPQAEITAFSMNPRDTAARHGIRSYPIRRHTWEIGYKSTEAAQTQERNSRVSSWLKTTRNPAIRVPRSIVQEMAFLGKSLRKLRSFDMLIVSGGGQLTERSGPWGFPYAIFIWVFMAKIARVRCAFLNVGAGPLNHPLSKFLVRHSLSAADYVSFRDSESQQLARTIGFAGSSCVFPDSAYNVDVPPIPVRAGDGGPSLVGLAPMPYPYCDPRECPSNPSAVYENLIDKMAVFASELVRRSYSLDLFGSDAGADPSAIEDLRTELKARHGILMPQSAPIDSVRGLMNRIAAMDYVVTCRFHGVVLAHIMNKPVLAISHHMKVANLMNALGLSKYCVDIRTFNPIDLAGTFASLVDDREEVKLRMAASLARYRSRLTRQFDDLFLRNPDRGMISEPIFSGMHPEGASRESVIPDRHSSRAQ